MYPREEMYEENNKNVGQRYIYERKQWMLKKWYD